MIPLAEAWDARVAALLSKSPSRLRMAALWLRHPDRKVARFCAALLFILGGCLAILPVLGLWMLPFGLALLAEDVPALKPPLECSARWIERTWCRLLGRPAPAATASKTVAAPPSRIPPTERDPPMR